MSKRSQVISGAIWITIGVVSWSLLATGVMPWLASHHWINQSTGSTMWYPGFLTWLVLVSALYALSWPNAIKEWNRRPVLLFGRYHKTAGPGLVFIEPLFFTTLPDVPVQDVVVGVQAPSVQTKDNVRIDIIGVLTFRIDETKVKDAVVEVSNVSDAIMKRAISTLNDVGSITDLDHLLENRVKYCDDSVMILKERVQRWGVTVHALELQGFKINDHQIEQSIAMKARAQKEASAELTRAEMQKQIAVALNDAANTLDEKGRWLKGIETLIELCRSAHNNTILIPTDMPAQALIAPLALRTIKDNSAPTEEVKAAA